MVRFHKILSCAIFSLVIKQAKGDFYNNQLPKFLEIQQGYFLEER